MVHISSVAVFLLVGVLATTTEAFNSIATTSNRRDVFVGRTINIIRSTAASTSFLRSTAQEVSGFARILFGGRHKLLVLSFA